MTNEFAYAEREPPVMQALADARRERDALADALRKISSLDPEDYRPTEHEARWFHACRGGSPYYRALRAAKCLADAVLYPANERRE